MDEGLKHSLVTDSLTNSMSTKQRAFHSEMLFFLLYQLKTYSFCGKILAKGELLC